MMLMGCICGASEGLRWLCPEVMSILCVMLTGCVAKGKSCGLRWRLGPGLVRKPHIDIVDGVSLPRLWFGARVLCVRAGHGGSRESLNPTAVEVSFNMRSFGAGCYLHFFLFGLPLLGQIKVRAEQLALKL